VGETTPTDQVNGASGGGDAGSEEGPSRTGYRFPPRNPHTGAAVGLLRSQFPTSETR
jgi:hypothetical protein